MIRSFRLFLMAAPFLFISLVAYAQPAPKTAPNPQSPTNDNSQSTISFMPKASWNNAPRKYIVQPGDTLWDISRRFLGSPWYWPKLWSKNPHIQNPHWIFPGNRIFFYKSGQAEVPVKKKKKEEEDDNGFFKGDKSNGGITLGKVKPYDINKTTLILRRDNFIEKKALKKSGKIISGQGGQLLISKGDAVYIKFKNLRNVTAGEKYSIFSIIGQISDPKTKQKVGYLIRLHGTLQISELKKKIAVGRVTEAFYEISPDLYVGRYMSNKVVVKIRRNEALVKGRILQSSSRTSIYGQFFQIFINKGSRHGVRVGNTFDLYRIGGSFHTRSLRLKVQVKQKIGLAIAIDVRKNNCVAFVIRSSVEIQAGDLAETSLIN